MKTGEREGDGDNLGILLDCSLNNVPAVSNMNGRDSEYVPPCKKLSQADLELKPKSKGMDFKILRSLNIQVFGSYQYCYDCPAVGSSEQALQRQTCIRKSEEYISKLPKIPWAD